MLCVCVNSTAQKSKLTYRLTYARYQRSSRAPSKDSGLFGDKIHICLQTSTFSRMENKYGKTYLSSFLFDLLSYSYVLFERAFPGYAGVGICIKDSSGLAFDQ